MGAGGCSGPTERSTITARTELWRWTGGAGPCGRYLHPADELTEVEICSCGRYLHPADELTEVEIC
jgi:hypothetical protein